MSGRVDQALQRTGVTQPLADLGQMLANLLPTRRPGVWVYALLPENVPAPASALAVIREEEGITVVLPEAEALRSGQKPLFSAALITLCVRSALGSCGLTAAVAAALTREQIPCNMLAGYHHDHILVPEDRAADALACLERLQAMPQIQAHPPA